MDLIFQGQREQKANKGINAGDKKEKVDEENKENQNQRPYRRQRRFARNRIQVDFSVKVCATTMFKLRIFIFMFTFY